MVWEYKELQKNAQVTAGQSFTPYSKCRYCSTAMVTLGSRQHSDENLRIPYSRHDFRLDTCPVCGWWAVYHNRHDEEGSGFSYATMAALPVLRNVDIADVSTPLSEVRQYLLARYQDRFDVNPRTLEQLVGSVFANTGCHVEVTAHSRDDGIDVIVLRNQQDEQIGIQVKRYRKKIRVDQVREFAGALLLGGMTRGIFVTVSDYTRDAKNTASRYGEPERLLPIEMELWNAERFYDAMRLSWRPAYASADDETAPFYRIWKDPRDLTLIAHGGMGYE